MDKPTRNDKTLSVIITDLHEHYEAVRIFEPLETDDPETGKKSDHKTPVLMVGSATKNPSVKYKVKVVRPLPRSRTDLFGRWISEYNFEEVKNAGSTTEKVEKLSEVLNEKLEEFCPTKRVNVFNNDKEFLISLFMTDRLQKIRRVKAKEYRRKGRSEKFKKLQRKYEEVKKKNLSKYIEEKVESIRHSNPRQFFKLIKQMGSRPDEKNNPG